MTNCVIRSQLIKSEDTFELVHVQNSAPGLVTS